MVIPSTSVVFTKFLTYFVALAHKTQVKTKARLARLSSEARHSIQILKVVVKCMTTYSKCSILPRGLDGERVLQNKEGWLGMLSVVGEARVMLLSISLPWLDMARFRPE